MKKLLFVIALLILVIPFTLADLCYQETANVSSGCGGISGGNYTFGLNFGDSYWQNKNNIIDGSYSTGGYFSLVGNKGNFTVNYKIPVATSSAKWQIKATSATVYCYNGTGWFNFTKISGSPFFSNVTIPLSCLDNPNRAFTGRLQGYFTALIGIYEEGVWWNRTNFIDNCSQFHKTVLNYTLYDEDNRTIIPSGTSPQIKITALIHSPNGGIISNYSKTFNKNNAAVCIDGNYTSSDYLLSAIAEYSATNYAHEFMYLQKMPLTSLTIPQKIPLYALLSSRATSFLITFKNNVFLPIPGAVIEIYRYYTNLGTNLNVEDGLTDNSGQTIGHFVKEDAIYSFVVKKDNAVLATFNSLQAICLANPCQINLNQFQTVNSLPVFGQYANLQYAFTAFNKTKRQVEVTYATGDSSLAGMSLNVTVMDSYMNLTGCRDVESAASGTLNCIVPQGYGNTSIIAKLYYNGNLVTTRQYSLLVDGFVIFGYTGIFMAAIIVLMLALMAVSDPIGTVIFTIIGVFGIGALGLITLGPMFTIGSVIIWLIVAGAILIYKIHEQD